MVVLQFSSAMLLALAADKNDFYDMLEVNRQASTVEIRKAFKKLALTMHPDKNRDDPDAHEKFIRLNRAYEVLKDDDLRKKYDLHGEEGLKEGGPSGGGYQSWSFYNQQFGIYDDDPEIITLSRSDYDVLVEGTNDMWFINFYSPHCSHCHDLAPTWREVARELVGVVRMGAVNCEDDGQLCRQKGIRSYPTLLLYPEREKYYSTKTRHDLVNFVLDHVRSKVIELWQGNFHQSTDPQYNHLPWLISFCGKDSGECLEDSTLRKLSAILNELVNVGRLICTKETEKICEGLSIESGLYFFESGRVAKGQGIEMTSYDTQEIAYSTMKQLPDVEMIDGDTLQIITSEAKNGKNDGWLVHFVEGQFKDVELRKLPSLVDNVKVGRIDCQLYRSQCNHLHIHKFPTFVLFKVTGGQEIHYGRQTAHDIAAFVKDSHQNFVTSLHPGDFPSITLDAHPWFVDFFAPWCPPCLRLLPEFRKASRMVGMSVKFGTVDCTVHATLCMNYNVHSYPTTILYNLTKPHHYHGHHSASEIVQFIQDIMKPSVTILEAATFQSLVAQRSLEQTWIVDFYAPWCGPCQQLEPEWRRLAKMFDGVKNVHVGQVDCQEHKELCQSLNVNSYPSIRLYPQGRADNKIFHLYNGWYRDAQSIRAWVFDFLPTKTHKLDETKFREKVLKSSRPWIIDFFAPWCGHCQVFAPEFERVAMEVKGRVKAGKVNCDENARLCQMAGIQAYPSIRYYSPASESFYGADIDSQNADYIIQYLNNVVPLEGQQTKDEL
ncbi:hypothetical protein HELRODRAFT_102482 [Helobdella robusta]|uniref:DnaJ homolog subfamily C member 10 n=1 Tax=Helobdella robusta TaxID=6412 RepID=T1ED98_HELRO|nr:hypothetical protein HELRODRAFT_102482 [Helobdella robusta]ESN95836.1 hypothetical protein HELRODRAFT_102482 [Helobdella robusta]